MWKEKQTHKKKQRLKVADSVEWRKASEERYAIVDTCKIKEKQARRWDNLNSRQSKIGD